MGEQPVQSLATSPGAVPAFALHSSAADVSGYFRRGRSSKERTRIRLYALLLVLDLLCIAAAFAVADLLRFGRPLDGPGPFLATAFVPLFAALAFQGRAYSIEVLTGPRVGIRRALGALAIAASTLAIGLFYSQTAGSVSRIVFAAGMVIATVLLTGSRLLVGHVAGRRHHWNFINEVLLVDGVNVFPARGQIVVFASQVGLSPDVNDPAAFDRLGRLLANCDRVVLACPPGRRRSWTRTLKCAGISVEIMTPELDALGPLQIRQSPGGTALLVAVGPLGLRDRIAKRCLDLAIAIPALVAGAPVMLAIAVAIKISSPGPVCFRQSRVGRGNRIFNVVKFRTMRIEQCDGEGRRSASREDGRVTAVGRFLRRTSLDELPQLVNVIRGDMSIVGPRPHALASTAGDALFWQAEPRYWERGAVKPGITGLAQVRGLRGATHRREDLCNRVQADLEYLLGWTLWRDLRIILRTARVLIHPNAY